MNDFKQRLLAPALATVSMDLRRALLGRRGIPLLILGALPPFLTLLIGHFQNSRGEGPLIAGYANLFSYFILVGSLFFGTAWCFSNLFRGEILERSLHYFFLTPVRREAITLGKYLTGVLTTWIVFVPSVILSYALLFGQGDAACVAYLMSAKGLTVLVAYISLTMLATATYGAVFLALGLMAKSPFIPILVFWLFERMSLILPTMLKRFTLFHYLQSLLPVPTDSKAPLAILAEPEPLFVALLVPLVLAGIVIVYACRRVRHLEISYGVE